MGKVKIISINTLAYRQIKVEECVHVNMYDEHYVDMKVQFSVFWKHDRLLLKLKPKSLCVRQVWGEIKMYDWTLLINLSQQSLMVGITLPLSTKLVCYSRHAVLSTDTQNLVRITQRAKSKKNKQMKNEIGVIIKIQFLFKQTLISCHTMKDVFFNCQSSRKQKVVTVRQSRSSFFL